MKTDLSSGITLKGSAYTYRIERTLGSGTFGITYLATILSGAGALDGKVHVCIKEFFMHDVNGREGSAVTASTKNGLWNDYRKKFEREARRLAAIKHPGVVQVLEAFNQNNTSYYSMEYLGGGSLDGYIKKKGHLTEPEALRLFKHVTDAMSYLHAQHMLHLDLKPGNIMMKDDGTTAIIDFGLAKQFDSNGNPESSSTIGAGTPGYAPIEQAHYNGENRTAFPATMDVYALGATLFKMLTGKRPPEASQVLNEGLPTDELHRCGVSQRTLSAIEHAMEPMVARRTPTVAALASELAQPYQPTQPVQPEDPEDEATIFDPIVEPEQPAETTQPIRPTKPTKPTRPTRPIRPVRPADPATPIKQPSSNINFKRIAMFVGIPVVLIVLAILVMNTSYMRERQAFGYVTEARNIAACELYMKSCPDGKRLEEVMYMQANFSDNAPEYLSMYLQRWGENGAHSDEIRARYDSVWMDAHDKLLQAMPDTVQGGSSEALVKMIDYLHDHYLHNYTSTVNIDFSALTEYDDLPEDVRYQLSMNTQYPLLGAHMRSFKENLIDKSSLEYQVFSETNNIFYASFNAIFGLNNTIIGGITEAGIAGTDTDPALLKKVPCIQVDCRVTTKMNGKYPVVWQLKKPGDMDVDALYGLAVEFHFTTSLVLPGKETILLQKATFTPNINNVSAETIKELYDKATEAACSMYSADLAEKLGFTRFMRK